MDAEKFSEYFDEAPIFYGELERKYTLFTGLTFIGSTWSSISRGYPLHSSA